MGIQLFRWCVADLVSGAGWDEEETGGGAVSWILWEQIERADRRYDLRFMLGAADGDGGNGDRPRITDTMVQVYLTVYRTTGGEVGETIESGMIACRDVEAWVAAQVEQWQVPS